MKKLIRQICSDLYFYGGTTIFRKFITYCYNREFKVMLYYRIMHYLQQTRLKKLNVILSYRLKRKFACDIDPFAEIGNNVKIAHAIGIHIGRGKIHDNVTIFQHVTIGSHGVLEQEKQYPVIEEGVKIYAGAKILGGVTVGKSAVIGANAVVTRNIPENAIVVAAPLKIVG